MLHKLDKDGLEIEWHDKEYKSIGRDSYISKINEENGYEGGSVTKIQITRWHEKCVNSSCENT